MRFEEGQTVGIDLGTTFSTVAQLDQNGTPVAVPNEEDEVETASMVLLADRGHVIVGPKPSRAAFEDPDHVVARIKRHMGEEYRQTFDGRLITPEFLSALILKKLKQDAEKVLGPIHNAVITVPYYFNDMRRKATQDAGRIAGLNVVDIINEPTAATLCYAWHSGILGSNEQLDRPKLAVVYDLGGGTFDVTFVQFTASHFEVLATDGDVQLGGVDWDDRLLDYVAEEYMAKFGEDPRKSPQTVHGLRYQCNEAKEKLSKSESTQIACRHKGKVAQVTVTRGKFEELTQDLLQRTIDTLMLVMDEAKKTPEDIDAIVLVGGSTLMPAVSRAIEAATGKKPYDGMDPHTSVAKGAAIHAAILEARYRPESGISDKAKKMLSGVRQENVNSHGLGIVISRKGEKVNHVMIPKNTRIPVEKRQTFKTNVENQERVRVQVLEGDAPEPDACSLLGNCRITELPQQLPKGSPVEVCYAFTEDGRIHISAKELTGGKEAHIEIERQGSLSDVELESLTKLATDYNVQ